MRRMTQEPSTQIQEPMTPQERTFVMLVLRGITPQAAGESIGLSTGASLELYNQERIQQTLMQMRDMYDPRLYQAPEGLKFTKDQATLMLLEAHRKSKDSTEEIKAVVELSKLHDLYAPQKTELTIHTHEQLRELDDKALQELAGMDIDLDPSSYEISYDEED